MSPCSTRLWITYEIAERTPTAISSGTSQFRPRQRFATQAIASTNSGSIA